MEELRNEIFNLFVTKCKNMKINATLELCFIDDAPIDDEFVYGEAFPKENKVWLEVVPLDASMDKIREIICHELLHLKYPELKHDSKDFNKLIDECINSK